YALCRANKAVDEARVLLSRANFHARGHVDGRRAGRADGSGDISRGEPAGEDIGHLAVDRRQHSPIEGRPVAPVTGAVGRRLRIKEDAVRRPRIGKRTLYIRAALDTHGLHYGDSPLAADLANALARLKPVELNEVGGRGGNDAGDLCFVRIDHEGNDLGAPA